MRHHVSQTTVRFSVVLLGIGLATATGCTSASPDRAVDSGEGLDVVSTANGAVRGLVTDHRAFRRIPYAAPPVGRLRWKAPVPVRNWRGVRDARVFGKPCSQVGESTPNSSENCLTLNIYTPLRGRDLPVMVWIHGGAFTTGSGSDYDGSLLATKENVVVVTINYRLGVFGFMATPALAAESTDGSVGNYGLMDQQLALKWVRDNIARFGGNRDNVTIFGGSAGGASVCAHLISPGSAGLFHRAISQSGPCTSMTATASANYQVGATVTSNAGCTNSDPARELACMRSLPADSIVAASADIPVMSATIDEVTVPGRPAEVIASGNFNRVPMIMGANAAEGRLLAYLAYDARGTQLTDDQYPKAISSMMGEDAGAVLDEYPLSNYSNPSDAYAAVVGDSWFNCDGRTIIRELVAQDVPVYAYEFSDPETPAFRGVRLGPTHASELAYVFQTPLGSADSTGLTPAQMELSDQIQAYWANFARTGDPNGRGLPEWNPHSLEDDNYLELTSVPPGPQPTTTVSEEHNCAFWDEL